MTYNAAEMRVGVDESQNEKSQQNHTGNSVLPSEFWSRTHPHRQELGVPPTTSDYRQELKLSSARSSATYPPNHIREIVFDPSWPSTTFLLYNLIHYSRRVGKGEDCEYDERRR